MKLIIVRHGEAEDPLPGEPDYKRPLTIKGKADIKKLAQFIKNSPLKVSHIFNSPYLRTRMTAEILAQELDFTGETISCPELEAGMGCVDILKQLRDFTNSETVLIIGHSPDVSHFAGTLLGNQISTSWLPFSPGTSVAINVPREHFERGQLIWSISPDFLDEN